MVFRFGHFIPCFPAFSSVFLSLSCLSPVSGFAQALKSLSEFFLLAFATQSAWLEDGGCSIRSNHGIFSSLLKYIECLHLDVSIEVAISYLSNLLVLEAFTE